MFESSKGHSLPLVRIKSSIYRQFLSSEWALVFIPFRCMR